MDILFGYDRRIAEDGHPGLSVYLYPEGTLEYRTGDREEGTERHISFTLSGESLRAIREILHLNRERLRMMAEEINGPAPCEGENCFIFEDVRIVDWDLTRWYLEEDRKKHPEYYRNSVKVELTETFVRGVFDEICAVIERDGKELRYMRMMSGAVWGRSRSCRI